MATTASTFNTTGRTPDSGSWVHGCFIVKVGSDFETYKAVMEYALQDEIYGSSSAPALDPRVKEILSSNPGADGSPLPLYFSKRKCRDTSLGGNDAINPLPQFSVDDDIANTLYETTNGKDLEVSMGQVYSENYDDLQQILYLGFGIPLFSNVGNFWATATDMELTGFVNKGSGITLGKIGYLIGSMPIRLFNIATIPYKFIGAMTDSLSKVPISKYYTFSSQMPMYFRFVNTILVTLAANMNIVGSSDSLTSTGSDVSGKTALDLNDEGTRQSEDLSGLSSVFRDYGLDMARIMTKRYFYENGNDGKISNKFTDQAIIDSSNLNGGLGVADAATVEPTDTTTTPEANATNSEATNGEASSSSRNWIMQYFDNFAAAYGTAIYDGHLFIGFRIDKGMGGSESFSNSTGESQIAQLANEKYQQGKDAKFKTMGGEYGDGAIASILGGVVDFISGAVSGAFNTIKMDPLGAALSGSAKIDIPEVWMSSSYSRSASFTITCLAPYGDFETIFQSEYVPLACILAGSLPRGTGHSSHSSPFVCQAYCKGIFSSPLCIIESLEITRGADQFGMNAARLPLKLTMNVTLKDLSPVMYMTMGSDRGILNTIMGTDDNFGEYMMTLAGMGLRDRLSPYKAMRRKVNILLSTLYKNKLSPYMLGMEGGAKYMASRLVSSVVSAGRNLPGN